LLADLDNQAFEVSRPKFVSLGLIKNLAQIADWLAIVLSGVLCFIVYNVIIIGGVIDTTYIFTIVTGAFIVLPFCFWLKAYDDQIFSVQFHSIQKVLAAWMIAFAILLFVAFALKISDYFSRVWVVSWFLSGACSLVVCRWALGQWVDKLVVEGLLVERAVIYGAGLHGQQFAAQMASNVDRFTQLIGFIDDRSSRVPHSWNGLEHIGDSNVLLELIRANKIDQVFVALPPSASDRQNQVLNMLADTPVRVHLVFDPVRFKVVRSNFRFVNHFPVVQIADRPLTGWSHISKEIEDKILSLLILFLISPLLIMISIAIRLDSRGPILFKQHRYGYNNSLIEVWKFRSMHVSDDRHDTMQQATRDDQRVTRVGHFLRRTSLDELPQFINVLLGDMSIVGPRPHAIEHLYEGSELADTVARYAARHRVKPGITGWAQVNGWRGETDTIEKLRKRVEYDLYYIENWTIWLDLWIIFKTLVLILKDDNAY
jgi:Undecaprenyl-phosphate glucose phosphotransferase